MYFFISNNKNSLLFKNFLSLRIFRTLKTDPVILNNKNSISGRKQPEYTVLEPIDDCGESSCYKCVDHKKKKNAAVQKRNISVNFFRQEQNPNCGEYKKEVINIVTFIARKIACVLFR